MLKYNIIFLLVVLFFTSCKNNAGNQTSEVSGKVSDFLKQLKNKELPIIIKGCKYESLGVNDFNTDRFTWLDSTDVKQGMYPYCTFKSNGNYVAVIYLGLADCYLPYLITYTPDGRKIDEGFFGIGGCGAGPGFECEEFMTIRKDYSVYTSDTIRSSDVDSLGNTIKSTEEYYVTYKEGKILPTGKIELSKELKKKL